MSTNYILDDAPEVNNNYIILEEENKNRTVFSAVRRPVALRVDEGGGVVAPKQKLSETDLESWDIESLIGHIIDRHHKSSRKNAAIIYDLSQEVAHKHGKDHPETRQLASSMFLFLHDYLNNLKKEEQILFPNIRQLVQHNGKSGKGMYSTFGLLEDWIKLVKENHQSSAEYLRLFHELTNDYSLPADACSRYKALFEKLKEFEADFVLHSYVETKILFPKALAEDEPN
jgi:regulator of cell morphogenesis and NO signaling